MKTIKEILTESNGVLKLAVHNGVFHADDVLCVAMIKNKLKELGLSREVEIIRSRNPETLAQADIIMDVGGGKYDHHSLDNPAQENGVLMAACGKVADELFEGEELKMLHDYVLDSVQASDNGQKRSDLGENLFSWIRLFNTSLSESSKLSDERFAQAVEMAEIVFDRQLFMIREEIADRKRMKELLSKYAENENQYSSHIFNMGKLMHWQAPVCDFNATYPDKKIKVVVFRTPTGQWNYQSVPTYVGAFINHAPMPEKYVKKEVKFPKGTIFVHANGFMAAHETEEAAMNMAKEAVALASASTEIKNTNTF